MTVREQTPTVLIQYIDIKEQIEQLQERLEKLKPQVEELIPAETNKLTYLGYSFLRVFRKTYQYSPVVKLMEEELKREKKAEEKSGMASYIEKPYIQLRNKFDSGN